MTVRVEGFSCRSQLLQWKVLNHILLMEGILHQLIWSISYFFINRWCRSSSINSIISIINLLRFHLLACNSQVLDSVPQEPRQRACDNLKWYLELKVMLLYSYKSQCAKIGAQWNFAAQADQIHGWYRCIQWSSPVLVWGRHTWHVRSPKMVCKKACGTDTLGQIDSVTSFDGGLRINRYEPICMSVHRQISDYWDNIRPCDL